MMSAKYGWAAVGRFLLEGFERRRLAQREWTPAFEESLRGEAREALATMQQQLHELELDDPEHWVRMQRMVDEVLIPRYRALATAELALAKREYGIWRGGDLVARGAFALVAFVLGIIAVESPYIPVYEKWFPALLFVAGPFFPDIMLWWYQRRYAGRLGSLVEDLARAEASQDAYKPLSELKKSYGLEGPADEPEGTGTRSPGTRSKDGV